MTENYVGFLVKILLKDTWPSSVYGSFFLFNCVKFFIFLVFDSTILDFTKSHAYAK